MENSILKFVTKLIDWIELIWAHPHCISYKGMPLCIALVDGYNSIANSAILHCFSATQKIVLLGLSLDPGSKKTDVLSSRTSLPLYIAGALSCLKCESVRVSSGGSISSLVPQPVCESPFYPPCSYFWWGLRPPPFIRVKSWRSDATAETL